MADSNFLFNSNYNYQKIYLNAVESIVVPNNFPTVNTYTISHNLGYVPTCRIFLELVTGQLWPLSINQYSDIGGGTGGTNPVYGYAYVTTSQVMVNLINTSGASKTMNMHYRIYYDA